MLECPAKGMRRLRFETDKEASRPLEALLNEQGHTPLPHYIRRPEGETCADSERYQTVFATETGAIAAPTAGLHFTPKVISALQARQARVIEITLHVGYGTFEPVRVDNVTEHRVAPEFFQIGE